MWVEQDQELEVSVRGVVSWIEKKAWNDECLLYETQLKPSDVFILSGNLNDNSFVRQMMAIFAIVLHRGPT